MVAPDGNGTVVNTTSGLRADGSAVVGWDYVGTINGASGVYLGNGWVITASHVGASTFTLGATSYSPVANSAVRILNTDPLFANWATDLVVYKVAGVGGERSQLASPDLGQHRTGARRSPQPKPDTQPGFAH